MERRDDPENAICQERWNNLILTKSKFLMVSFPPLEVQITIANGMFSLSVVENFPQPNMEGQTEPKFIWTTN